ncbi:MAG: hypothetical protein AAB650_01780, partial [Patescibacteria group bacterium]
EYLAKILIGFFREALLIKVSPDSNLMSFSRLVTAEAKEQVGDLASFSASDIADAIVELIEALAQGRRSPIPQLPLELAIISIINGRTKAS